MKLFPRKSRDTTGDPGLDLRRDLSGWDSADEVDDTTFAQAIAEGRARDPEWFDDEQQDEQQIA